MRRPLRTLLVLVAVLPACSNAGDGGPPEHSPPPQPAVASPRPCADLAERPFTVTMRDDRFAPACLVVSGAFPFHLRNRGSHRHNLTIPGTGFSVDVRPARNVPRPALIRKGVPPGTYRFFCRFHRSLGMTGELHVLAA